MTLNDITKKIIAGKYGSTFKTLYGEKSAKMPERYLTALREYKNEYSEIRKDSINIGSGIRLFSAPGRTEIGGNHTDHQRGCVLAAAIDLDIIAVAKKNDDNIANLKSLGYKLGTVDLSDLSIREEETEKSPSLIRGIAARFSQKGYKIGGFDAYTTSNVLKGSGLSSSAAFEILVCNIFNHLYNDGKVSPQEMAQISQYSEINYYGKPCGLMDQMASSVGGFVGIDFGDADNPLIERVDFDFKKAGHALCITDTGGSHSDLSGDYAAVPSEMKEIAEYFEKDILRLVGENEFYEKLPILKEKFSHRAILRTMHFFADNKYAVQEKEALQNGRFDEFLSLIKKSGISSQTNLQNIYTTNNPHEQGVGVGLALSAKILGDKGAYRVHGGGFAGTIQAFVPFDILDEYKTKMEVVFGQGACHQLAIRSFGGVEVTENL